MLTRATLDVGNDVSAVSDGCGYPDRQEASFPPQRVQKTRRRAGELVKQLTIFVKILTASPGEVNLAYFLARCYSCRTPMDAPLQLHKSRLARDMAILFLFVMALTVPFLNQAFHLDDQEFINFAKVQLEHPFQFFLLDHDYMNYHFDVFRTTHPPVLSSLLAVAMWLSGEIDEPILHAVYLIFPLIAVGSMYSLGRRFCHHPLAAALLLASTMGFLVMAHTLRGDVPGTAMWLATIAVFVNAVDRTSLKRLLAAGAVMMLAFLVSYQSLSLIPLLLVYLAARRRLSPMNVFPIVWAAAAFSFYALFVYYSSGLLPSFSYGTVGAGYAFGLNNPLDKGRAIITITGLASVFPLTLLAVLFKPQIKHLQAGGALLLIIGLLAPFPSYQGGITAAQMLWLLPGIAAGLAVLGYVFAGAFRALIQAPRGGIRNPDQLFLASWIFGVIAYNFLLLPSATVRHLLPMFPALVLVFVRLTEDRFQYRPQLQNAFLCCSAVLSLALAIPASVADYRLADSYRAAAEGFKNEYAASGEKVWFQGEFGFRYYMEESGFSYLGVTAKPQPGDILIRSETSSSAGNFLLFPPPPADQTVELRRFIVADPFPFRIRTPKAGTGFYSHRMGPVPIAVSTAPLDEYTVYRFR